MASSTSKSRPVARSYVSTPGLRQQRFDARRRAVKGEMRKPRDTSKAEARRQNTLTQMDFVRLGFSASAALEDDGLEYLELEYEPMVKQEEVKPSPKDMRTTREAQSEMPARAPGKGKRKRSKSQEEMKQTGSDEDWTEDANGAEEYTRATHCPRKSKRRGLATNDPPLPSSSPRASRRTTSAELKKKSTTSLSNSSANTPTPAIKRNTATKTRTPLQSVSANPRILASSEPAERSAKGPTFHVPPVPRRTKRREVLPIVNVDTNNSASETVPVAEAVPNTDSLPSPIVQQTPVALDITDGHNLRYSDPGLTIPDSEDEDETQDTKPGPSMSPTMLRVGRLASQKSFSQATTVDVTQSSQRLPPTQRIFQPAKPTQSPSDANSTPNRGRRSNFLPPPSSLGSNTSIHGDSSAFPITESQLLPDSLMHFELPRLPGWSQNSEEAE